ncbi:MAG TPA: dTMP kinase [Burkholderiales bacterium]|nr:dTMP kinase [Burkholderiales bacterium]
MTRSARFITLEGVDGAGKSTHQQFIADAVVAASGQHAIVTREPGGTDLAERLREAILTQPMDAMAETLLIFAARADHVARVILPALQAGTWVVCDRFLDATIAYQGAGKGVPLGLIERLAEAAHPGVRPDRTIVFDCSYQISRQRLNASGKKLDRFEREDQAFFERVRNAYLSRAEEEPDRIRLIDASADVATIRKALEKALAF